MTKKIKNIYIITDIPFPVGLAPTNRMISYAKGFTYHKIVTKVICFRKTEFEFSIKNKEPSGNIFGFEYKYLSNSTIRSKYFLIRKLDDIYMILSLFLYTLLRIDKNSVVIYYSIRTSPAIFLKISSFLKGYKIFKEETEHPSIRIRRKSSFSTYIYFKIHYKLFDGLLVITNSLREYFNKSYSKMPTLHVPMMVDFGRFRKKVITEKIIMYCGILNDNKDGVNILIESFFLISKNHPEYKLVLIGKSKSENKFASYKNRVAELKLSNRVIFRGELSNHEIPDEISKSEILVLPRPDSIQAQYGFPTKLGEYLATGNPVVTTVVGEIPIYLKDKENAFLSKPGNIQSLAEKLDEVLSSPKKAKIVGQNGRNTANLFFNNIEQTKKIIDFIN